MTASKKGPSIGQWDLARLVLPTFERTGTTSRPWVTEITGELISPDDSGGFLRIFQGTDPARTKFRLGTLASSSSCFQPWVYRDRPPRCAISSEVPALRTSGSERPVAVYPPQRLDELESVAALIVAANDFLDTAPASR